MKRPAKIWKKAQKCSLKPAEAFDKIIDILGFRVVCNNLSEVQAVVKMLQQEGSVFEIKEIKNMVSNPAEDGYRAIHVRTVTSGFYSFRKGGTPCEIQIRTLAQDTWAHLSRADFYGKNRPQIMTDLARALSDQLSAIDKMAQIIRNALDKPTEKAQEINDSDPVSPQRLALLYEQKYGEDLYEWSLHDWVLNLEEAEVETISEVKALLDDNRLRESLNRIAHEITGYDLEDGDWVVYSALVASEVSRSAGIRAVRARIQQEWDEITAVARRQVLPSSIEDFMDALRNGSISDHCFSVLDGMSSCEVCGTPVMESTELIVQSISEYYKTDKYQDELYELIEKWGFDNNYSVGRSFCSHCEYQMSKDD